MGIVGALSGAAPRHDADRPDKTEARRLRSGDNPDLATEVANELGRLK
jgi:hypothetical protein